MSYKNIIKKFFYCFFIINYLIVILSTLYLLIINIKYIHYKFIYFDIFILFFSFSFCLYLLVSKIKFYMNKYTKTQENFLKNELYITYGKNVVGVVHNIKNKLTPIYLLLNEISDENIDNDLKKFTKDQIINSDNIINLLNKLLYLTKIINKKNSSFVNVNFLIFSIYELLKTNLKFKNKINFKILKIGKPYKIEINAFELMQVIEIVLNNFWKYIKNKSGENNISIEINSIEEYISIKANIQNYKYSRSIKNFILNYTNKNNFNFNIIRNKYFIEYKIIFIKY